MPINPVQFAHGVCDEFLRYLFSAFPLSDPELADQARKLLERPSSLDIPLVKGPFISLSESFAKGESVQKMANDGILHSVMPGLIGYPTMYLHQQQVFEAVRSKQHVLVATGTGSGKTESFLYPIIDDLLRQRDQGTTTGLTAILVYPMNALANDQLDRLRDMLGGTGITFGQWVGTTPRNESDVQVDRFEGSSRQAFLDARRKRREEAQTEDRAVRPLAPLEECCSEEDIQTRQPRILLTNFRQLEVLTTRLPDVQMFAQAPLKYLVFDEAHTYAGATGAEVACLVRRLRALAGKTPDQITCIGTSATLSDPAKKEQDNDETTRRFASRFFGVDPSKVKLIGESYVPRQWPDRRYKPVAPAGDGMARIGRVLSAVTEPVNVAVIKGVVEELTGQYFEPGESWRDSLFNHLVTNEYVFQATQILKQPKWLDKAAWNTSQRLALGRLPEGDRASAELLAYLVLGAAAQKSGDSLLRPKVHFFIRGLDEMVVALDGTEAAPAMKLFLSLADAKEHHAGRHDDSFFPVLTCRSCGQHFFEKWYKDLEYSRGAKNQLKDFDHGNATQNDDGSDNAYWSTSPSETGTRLIVTNRLLEEADGGPSTKSGKWPRAFFCRQCGAMHRSPSPRCLADGCGHKEPVLPLMAFGSGLSSCPSCSSTSFQIGGRSIEPARKVQAVTVADVHILAQAMINAAPDGHKKLIIFADSRQDAAFQAGWMQDHARRIRLRHMMYSVIDASDSRLALDGVTDKLMDLFRKDQNLIDALLPELTGEEAPATFGHNKWVPVHKALRYMVLREFTTGVRRTDCLESMGLARLVYDGVTVQSKGIKQLAETLGVSPQEVVEGVCLILDNWRRNRILFFSGDPIFSRYHAKDDPYIQAGLLPLRDFHPERLLLEPNDKDKHARSILARKGASAIQALLKKWASRPQSLDVDAAAVLLWEFLTVETHILRRLKIRSRNDEEIGIEVWQIDAAKMVVEKCQERHRCTTCQRLATRPAPKAVCTRHNCHGTTTNEQPKQENYDVWLMGRPFVMVSAEEHTAQVPGEIRNRIENDFKSRNGRTNCLVATPTLEMGVNIGALDMALMRNVPPRPANYWQRAGRAGREERMAVVVTYCRRSPHDRYFFDDPLRILGGAIEAPTFNLRNPLMVAKHIRSAILSELLLRSQQGNGQTERIHAIIKGLFPLFIRNYLLDEENHFRETPTSTAPLGELLREIKDSLADRLVVLFAQHWPEEAAELGSRSAIESAIGETANELDVVIRRLHRRLSWARSTRSDLHRKKDTGLIEREEEQLLRRCDEFINSIVTCDRATYTLMVLGAEGFLPGYGVYEGGVKASARRGFARQSGPRAFDLSRNNVVALREFVPGNRLYANRGTFYVSRYHLGADETARIRTLHVNVEKKYVTDHAGDAAYGQSGGVPIDALPLTDLDLAHESRITEDENLRFSMPVSVMGRLRKRNRGGKALKIGDQEVGHVRGQGIELVNLGEAGRVKQRELGHWICSVCGAAKTPYAVPAEIAHFLKIHKERCGKDVARLALAVQADVDMLQFHAVADEAEGINIGEAIRTAATRLLDMGTDDVQLLIVQKSDDKLDLLIYDPMPGGSGLLEQMLARWQELIATAKELLAGCVQGCETACYSCLKTFRNQFHHEMLNRHKALELMERLNCPPEGYRDIVPLFEEERLETGTPSNNPEARLLRLLHDHHFPSGECRKRITTSLGIATEPDWVHEPTKVTVYLDGMSRGLHGDPNVARKDQIIRQAVELDGYTVIVVQSRDLDDPQAVRLHLRNIAQAMGETNLPVFGDGELSSASSIALSVADELLAYCDERCKDLIRACGQNGKSLPEVGYELQDDQGRVCAEAELAWPSKKLAVLVPEHSDAAAAFKSQGWKVFSVDDLAAQSQQLLDSLSE
ncbi:MAG: DEAD/DEAH box helicase [Planctomycetes bacterium]|nr:DEAD/DEAH box helicase [Planctomycetota bacterium]